MSSPHELIEHAFERLALRPGYTERLDQIQLARLLGDFIMEGRSGVIEAPTGLGKSLAALIPALAAATTGKRTAICTYTNVLAEQYWRKDLPLALELFDEADVTSAYLIGRSRYICLLSLDELAPKLVDELKATPDLLGTENEFLSLKSTTKKELRQLLPQVTVPTVCAGRACPLYDDCFYYQGRKKASEANIVITNHSVVLQDSFQAAHAAEEEGKGFLGKLDFIIIDEAHDLPGAAAGALEFELSSPKLAAVAGVSGRVERDLMGAARNAGAEAEWRRLGEEFRRTLDDVRRGLSMAKLQEHQTGILAVSPMELEDLGPIQQRKVEGKGLEEAKKCGDACREWSRRVHAMTSEWSSITRPQQETLRNAQTFVSEFGFNCQTLTLPEGVSVSYSGDGMQERIFRRDVVGVDGPLRQLLWDRIPTACLSATLAVDGNFEFFMRTTGATPDYTEILDSPFDYSTQAALYLPAKGRILDPADARKQNREGEYFHSVAQELSQIIRASGGRTLALFHSRREMEAVYLQMDRMEEFPLYMQSRAGAHREGERFKSKLEASLFGLRSFWTGFDAPGETCSVVVLVRIPFEVPIDPPALVRMGYLRSLGLDGFATYTLPMAKTMMRQGAGRLIRRNEDRGVIAILDPRLRTKPYGEEILTNLPPGMRAFEDITEALAHAAVPDRI